MASVRLSAHGASSLTCRRLGLLSRCPNPAPNQRLWSRRLHSGRPALAKAAKPRPPEGSPTKKEQASGTGRMKARLEQERSRQQEAERQMRENRTERRKKEKEPLSELFMRHRVPLVGAIVAGTLFFGYASYLMTVFLKAAPAGPCSDPSHTHAHAHDHEQGQQQQQHDGAQPAFAGAAPGEEEGAPTGLPPGLTRATAPEFDAALDWPELVMGLKRQRRRLAAECRGHVLEVAVGTGRNLSFYDWDDVADVEPELRTVRRLEKRRYGGRRGGSGDGLDDVEIASFTGVDVSAEVLDLARQRVRALVPGMRQQLGRSRSEAEERAGRDDFARIGAEEVVRLQGGRLRLIRADAEKGLPLPPQALLPPPPPPASPGPPQTRPQPPPPPQHYDTIIQTFGLCSVRNPLHLLQNMAALVTPNTGRILLLEHGRSNWAFVNSVLDRYAPARFVRFGCWWNRDLEAVVREAAREVPGLEVISVKRPGLLAVGTHLIFELRVVKKEEDQEKGGEERKKSGSNGKDEGASSAWSLPSLLSRKT